MLMPSSGVITATAPVAIPAFSAMKPLSRPITSTKKSRLWLSAVSRILSTASMTVLIAVSNPMVQSEPHKSLSMVPGNPTTGNPVSWPNFNAPVKVPFPPITTSPSTPASTRLMCARFRPSGLMKSWQRADFKMVPPRPRIFATDLTCKRLKSPSMSPWYPWNTPTTSMS